MKLKNKTNKTNTGSLAVTKVSVHLGEVSA